MERHSRRTRRARGRRPGRMASMTTRTTNGITTTMTNTTRIVVGMLSNACLFVTLTSPRVQSFDGFVQQSQFPQIERQSLAGLWSLTPRIKPMKEFTVYPKRPPEKDPELLLMLKEDGSFLRYHTDIRDDDTDPDALHEDHEDHDDELEMTATSNDYQPGDGVGKGNGNGNGKNQGADLDATWNQFKVRQQRKQETDKRLGTALLQQEQSGLLVQQEILAKGRWDFVDGKLILAVDRPANGKPVTSPPFVSPPLSSSPRQFVGQSPPPLLHDTLLVGRVIATYQTRLQDNPILVQQQQQEHQSHNTTSIHVNPPTTGTPPSTSVASPTTPLKARSLDMSLSVPKGSVKVGKFIYPKNHPSFFDQPMFKPVKRGTFSLRQVVGTHSTEQDTPDLTEKFQRADLYNKTFLLTSHPIQARSPKGKPRWSIKYNKMVYDPPNKAAAKAYEDAERHAAAQIRVLKVHFFANNTFCTVGGLGRAAILRGKFDVIGPQRDQLWMQVARFGFGRSVSGSVYSEGRMLNHEDAKTYWGTMSYEPPPQTSQESDSSADSRNSPSDQLSTEAAAADAAMVASNNHQQQRIEVSGSVLFGWGLEPMPVGRFLMRETTNADDDDHALTDEDEDDNDDDDVYYDGDEKDMLTLPGVLNGPDSNDHDGIDWSSTITDHDAFQ